MKKILILISSLSFGLLLVGCSSPAPEAPVATDADAQQKIEAGAKNIDAAPDMTPEQKQQAAQYWQQGAAGAAAAKETAGK